MADDHHRLLPRLVLAGQEAAALKRLHAQQIEDVGGDAAHRDTLRHLTGELRPHAGEVRPAVVEHPDVGNELAPRTNVAPGHPPYGSPTDDRSAVGGWQQPALPWWWYHDLVAGGAGNFELGSPTVSCQTIEKEPWP